MSFKNMFYRHETSDKNRALEIAIKNRKCDEVKLLLSTGADINHAINRDLDTMLHHATSSGIVYDILGYSADVEARNRYGKTPMHTAAENGRSVEVIRALLAHCADLTAEDDQGNTALNYAIKRADKNYDAIKELVMRGCKVTLDRHENWNANHRSPMDDAVLLDDMEGVRILIKYYVFNDPNAMDMNLRSYYRNKNYRDMLDFHKRCCDELFDMQMEIVNVNVLTTLLHFIRDDWVCRESLGKDEEEIDEFAEKCLGIVRSLKYPIYNDVIMSMLKAKLEKKCLVRKLSMIEVYSNLEQGKVALTSDASKALARFLPKKDLFNMIIAYAVPSTVPPEKDNEGWGESLSREVWKRLNDPSNSLCAFKIQKLE